MYIIFECKQMTDIRCVLMEREWTDIYPDLITILFLEDNNLHLSSSLIHHGFPSFCLAFCLSITTHCSSNTKLLRQHPWFTSDSVNIRIRNIDDKESFFAQACYGLLLGISLFSKSLNIMQYISTVCRPWKKQML